MLPHPTHRLKAWTGDVGKRIVFCSICGKEDCEEAIKEPCPGKFIDRSDDRKLDTKSELK